MLSHLEFGKQLQHLLVNNRTKTLLRVVCAPQLDKSIDFTGESLVNRSGELVAALALPKERSVVLLLLPHSPELFLLQLGLVLAGHIPAILAWPTSRIDADKYQRNLVHQLSNLPADLLVTLPRLAQNLAANLPYRIQDLQVQNGASYEKLFPAGQVSERLEQSGFPRRESIPDSETIFLQFSGGTTGAQKAIVVTASMLTRQLECLRETLSFSASDCVASWLPLYHDMGLIACYWMPLWHGAPSVQIGANDWVINPSLLFKYISHYRSTLCWLPNFAFAYMTQRHEQINKDYKLDSVRAWINCSEPVRLRAMTQFSGAFSELGVSPANLQASYAMAETVFAITQTQLGREPLTVARMAVAHRSGTYNQLAFDLIDDVYVSSGKPIRGVELRIVSPEFAECPEGYPGEIYVRSPFLFSGYWGNEGFQTHSFRDGWHATGDFGFIMNEELFVIGRFKDIAIVGGNNIYPEDVETVVNSIDGIYPGRVVAFGVEDEEYGTQSLAVVAEMRDNFTEAGRSDLEAAICKLVVTTIGVAPRYVAVVPQRWIVKSTAGKISRRETRERFAREVLQKS